MRSVFALQDGIVYALKQIALALHGEAEAVFTLGELGMLTEIAYDFDEKGKIAGRPANLKFLPNMRFTFASYAVANGTGFSLPAGEHQ